MVNTSSNMDSKHTNHSSLRWIVNVSESSWKPTYEQLQLLIALQPAEEAQRIQRLPKENPKRAVVGRMMLRAAASQGLNKDARDLKFGRTKGKKPFIQDSAAAQRGLNANVSHHGDWVVLGMEEKGLIGVDVSSTTTPRAGTSADFYFKRMESQLTAREWAAVLAAGTTDEELFHAFFVFWVLKEAYGKAVGIGVCLPFSRLELTVPHEMLSNAHQKNLTEAAPHQMQGSITATLDGIEQKDWEFEMYCLDSKHVMAVAVGPHSVAVPSWKAAVEALKGEDSFGSIMSGSNGPAVLDTIKTGTPPSISCLSIADLLFGAELERYQLNVDVSQ